ncbi:MAG TPA: MazG nucleotide pyrophosphohydrolase domain-containing protein [Gammaproteobacteria bacterium]|nr:MazG nucleotide pyrophosphohydrolase domain-containing protein [Gammaproteobacteria bacterium]
MPKATNDLLQKIINQEKSAAEFGFYWESIEQLLEQIQSECAEVKEAWLSPDNVHLKEEVGDLINATLSLCIFLKLDPFETLNESVEKFQRRYDSLVMLVKQDGLQDLKNKPLNILLDYWNRAKKVAKKI